MAQKDETDPELEMLTATIMSGFIAGRGISKPDEREHLIEDSIRIARRIREKLNEA